MNVNRYGEQGWVQQRSERLFKDGGGWFFAIRRGVDQGPYDSEMEARMALREFIEEQLQFEMCLAAES
ncbi:MAG: DUF6316 family protein [Gammaproteobacteria bacterium]|nr:DUF6316 family protein [Gammaproteobacteria bacterium]